MKKQLSNINERLTFARKIKRGYHFLKALFAVVWFRYPARNLVVIGVTGTDGKTTTSQAVYSILKATGEKTALINTVGAIIDDKAKSVGLHVTTPGPFTLQKLLKIIRDNGVKYVVIEVTSHGLDQYRVLGCNFQYGIITNITHDHLDYHKTYQNYLDAKAKLIEHIPYAILNQDDKSFAVLTSKISPQTNVVTYGIKSKADYTATNLTMTTSGMQFLVPALNCKVTTSLIGEFNVYNLLAAIAVSSIMNIPTETITKGIAEMVPPPGRLEKVDSKRDFDVYIDFAHTPNALEQLLRLLRGLTNKNLIVVFGAAGERDKLKRYPMGMIAATYCDYIVLTAEDPRTENVNLIIDDIARGCEDFGAKENISYFRIPDRRKAIDFAINRLAGPEDIVVITGKGHEKSMCYGKREYPWDEFETVLQVLEHSADAETNT